MPWKIAGEKVILPIWHRVTRVDVLKYSPILADRLAIKSASGVEQVVSELLKVVRPKDKYEKLLQDAILKWVAHGILPSVEELHVLYENINPDQLSRNEMAFLYCAYLARDDDVYEWTEHNRPAFSFGFLRGYLFKEANVDNSILLSFHIKKGALGMLGRSGATGIFGLGSHRRDLDLKKVVLSEVTVREEHGEVPAIYFCAQALDKKGLEVLLVRGPKLESFVRYMPELSDEESRQVAIRLLDLEGEE
jgi:hypothetical protein